MKINPNLDETPDRTGIGRDKMIVNLQRFITKQEVEIKELKEAHEKGFEEAYKMIDKETFKSEDLIKEKRILEAKLIRAKSSSEYKDFEAKEVELYDMYDKKLGEMKEYMVDKLDDFLGNHIDGMLDMLKDSMDDPSQFQRICEIRLQARELLGGDDLVKKAEDNLKKVQSKTKKSGVYPSLDNPYVKKS